MIYTIFRRTIDCLLGYIRNSWLYEWLISDITCRNQGSLFGSSRIMHYFLRLPGKAISRRSNSILTVAIIVSLIFSLIILAFRASPVVVYYVMGFVCLCVIAWLYTEFSFVLLVFSLVFSPRLPFPGLSTGLDPLYLSDFVLAAIFLVTLVRISSGELRRVNSYLDTPIIAFLLIATISAIRGILVHTIDNPIISLLYVFKRIEYFLIYYLILYSIKNKKQARLYVSTLLIAGCLLSIYGIYEHFYPFPSKPYLLYRIYDNGVWFQGQSNHFAGYLMLCICISVSLALYSRKAIEKLKFFFAGLIMLLAFLWTYSRQAYLAISIAIVSLFTLRKRRNILIVVSLVLIVFILCPGEIRNRLSSIRTEIFDPQAYYSSSLGDRLYAWRMTLIDFADYPLLGVGLGARHRSIYDNQYIMELCELGLAGLACFIWLLLRIFKLLVQSWRRHDDAFFKALSLGALTGFIGITVQAIASTAFIVTRIAGPFWFLLGVVAALPDSSSELTQA